MKKILLIALIGVLCVTAASCGRRSSKTVGTAPTSVTRSTVQPTTITPLEKEVFTINEGDPLIFSGTLATEGSAVILKLDTHLRCSLNGDGKYDGKKVYDIDSVQIDDDSYKNRDGDHVTVTGTAVLAHDKTHLRDIVLTNLQ